MEQKLALSFVKDITFLFGNKMGAFQPPSFGTKNRAVEPQLTIRLLTESPTVLANIDPPMLPNELVGVFNGYDGTIRLFVTSGDGRAYIPVGAS